MKPSIGAVTAICAGLMVVATTYLHGRMTDRWNGHHVSQDLMHAASLLEREFPQGGGEWEAIEDIDADPHELERAGAIGYVSRSFRNRENQTIVTAFVVCATPHKASGHTPDRCYPGAGFEIGETEHRETIVLSNGRTADTFVGTFRKSGKTLRVLWTYGVRAGWVAPQIARIALADEPSVYKLYVIVDETSRVAGEGQRQCAEFVRDILPEFDAAIERARSAGQDAKTPAGKREKARA